MWSRSLGCIDRPLLRHVSATAGKLFDVSMVASPFRQEICQKVQQMTFKPHVIGLLGNKDPSARSYGKFTAKTLRKDGIGFELLEVPQFDLEKHVLRANADPSIHGIIVFYPVFGDDPSFFGGSHDDYIRDCISIEKDVEGMCHTYRHHLYRNKRYLDHITPIADPSVIMAAAKADIIGTPMMFKERKCVLPCTPLAVVKVLEALDVYDHTLPVGDRMTGKTVTIVNRSEVLGRPLAAMLANDGAKVYSADITGVHVMARGVLSTAGSMSVADATRLSDVIITGVPDPSYRLDVSAVRSGAVVVNIAFDPNVDPGELFKHAPSATYVPLVGKVTIAMLERNLLRLCENFHSGSGQH